MGGIDKCLNAASKVPGGVGNYAKGLIDARKLMEQAKEVDADPNRLKPPTAEGVRAAAARHERAQRGAGRDALGLAGKVLAAGETSLLRGIGLDRDQDGVDFDAITAKAAETAIHARNALVLMGKDRTKQLTPEQTVERNLLIARANSPVTALLVEAGFYRPPTSMMTENGAKALNPREAELQFIQDWGSRIGLAMAQGIDPRETRDRVNQAHFTHMNTAHNPTGRERRAGVEPQGLDRFLSPEQRRARGMPGRPEIVQELGRNP